MRHLRDGWLLVLPVLLSAAGSFAQEQPPPTGTETVQTTPPPPAPKPVPKKFDSPASTLLTFTEAMDEGDYDLAVQCLDLSEAGEETGRTNADRLLDMFNRIERVVPRRHPSAADLAPEGPMEGVTEYVFFPRYPEHWWVRDRIELDDQQIVLEKTENGSWKFSAASVAGIDKLHDEVRQLPVLEGLDDVTKRSLTLRLESELPNALVVNRFLGVKYWQWLGLLLLILAGVVLDFTLRLALAVTARRLIARREGEARAETIRKMVRPFGLAAAAVFWLWTIRALGLPGEALAILLPAVRFFAMLAIVWAGFRVTDLIAEVFVGKAVSTETKFDDLLIPLVRKTVKIFIFVFGLIYIADTMNIEIAPLLAGLGIGGLGFAFAARDTLENFFGSVTVIVDRPFQVGDWVTIGDVEGTVETLGFRSTRIRTFYNSLVTIPNGNLVRANVDNYGRRKYRRWRTHITITYGTPPDMIEAFCEGIRELIRLHPYTRKDYYQVWLHQFGASSLDVLMYMFHEAPDWSTELRERHRLMLDIIRLADRLGVEFAFPTETVHLYQESRDESRSPAPVPKAGADEGAMGQGRAAAHQLTGGADWRKRKPEPYVFRAVSKVDEESQIESTQGGDAGES